MDEEELWRNNMSEERCVMCSDIIPEGHMVCPICEKKWKRTPIEVFKPEPDEVIVYKFKPEPLDLDDIIKVFDNIRDSFPNNTVISIPDNSCLEVFTKDTFIECLQNIIKQLED